MDCPPAILPPSALVPAARGLSGAHRLRPSTVRAVHKGRRPEAARASIIATRLPRSLEPPAWVAFALMTVIPPGGLTHSVVRRMHFPLTLQGGANDIAPQESLNH